MCTYYVLYDPNGRVFAAAGRGAGVSVSINYAKHFTSIWSAENWKRNHPALQEFTVKKICRY